MNAAHHSPEQPMLPGLEAPSAGLTPEQQTELSVRIARAARPVEYDETVSEAAADQGWGTTEPGTPIEDENRPRRRPEAIAAVEAANEKKIHKLNRRRESRFTDIDSDSHPDNLKIPEDEVYLGAQGPSPQTREDIERQKNLLRINESVRRSNNDPKMSLALLQAMTQRAEQAKQRRNSL